MMIAQPLQRALLTLITLAVSGVGSAQSESGVKWGARFVSPDKRFTAEFTRDESGYIHIRDNQTKKVYKVGSLYPLYSLKWTGDSQAMITCEHIAHGSLAYVVRFNGVEWKRVIAEPPAIGAPDRAYALIRQEIGWNSASLTYKVSETEPNGMRVRFSICSFRINTQTNEITRVVRRTVSEKTYIKLPFKP